MDLDFNICLQQPICQSYELRSMSLSEVCKNASSLPACEVCLSSRDAHALCAVWVQALWRCSVCCLTAPFYCEFMQMSKMVLHFLDEQQFGWVNVRYNQVEWK